MMSSGRALKKKKVFRHKIRRVFRYEIFRVHKIYQYLIKVFFNNDKKTQKLGERKKTLSLKQFKKKR